jgi:hypothetical protein
LCIRHAKESELYQLMLSIADHRIGLRPDHRRPDKLRVRRDPDDEVAGIRGWLEPRVDQLKKGDRPITYRQLRQVLSRFRVSLSVSDGNRADVFQEFDVPGNLFRRPRTEKGRWDA